MATITTRSTRAVNNLLIPVSIALYAVGLVAVYDAGYAHALDRSPGGNAALWMVLKQTAYGLVGLSAMVAMAKMGYWRLRKAAFPLLVISMLLLMMVWVPHVGIQRNGAHRWIGWGLVQVQPSELAKLSLIIYLAAYLTQPSVNVRKGRWALGIPLAAMAIVVGLVEREPDFGTAFVIFLSSMAVFYMGGARVRHLMAVAAAFAVLAGCSLALGHGFRQHRLRTFFSAQKDTQGAGYQVFRGLLAVGSGMVSGVGFGAGREKFYLPEASTDYVFATIAEETGLLGSLALVFLLLALVYSGMKAALRIHDPFGALLGAGITTMLSAQALINLGVVTGSLPATGVPLPFISSGGSSLVFGFAGIGIVLSIAASASASGGSAGR
ncbi:MAG: FtsW/RodA/SpoVE family cell cycle protein [Chthonomonadales bacterium]